MLRVLLTAAAAVLLLGAARPPSVDYRLGVQPQAGRPALLNVQIQFRGDADGETTLDLPNAFGSGSEAWRYLSDLQVKGAEVTTPGPAQRVLRHKPGARITVRYRVQSAYAEDPKAGEGNPYAGAILRPDWFAALGDFVFATPQGRETDFATFSWAKPPKGWRVVSDLEHGRMGRYLTVADVRESISLGSPRLNVLERPILGGTLRLATFDGSPFDAPVMADNIARTLGAERAFWNDQREPYLAALVPLARNGSRTSIGGTGRGDAFVLYSTTGAPDALQWTLAHELTHTWIAPRIGRLPDQDEPAYYWLSEGFTDFFTIRALLRGGLITPSDAVARLDSALRGYDANPARTAPRARVLTDFWKDPKVQQLPYQRGLLLALKWDEDIRRRSGGKLDLDDVILRMRDHYQQFPRGQGPDVITGLVSAAWVTAKMDLRPDIARYADAGAQVTFPETLFDGCLDARVTISPGFDSGFDHAGSFSTKVVRGVRARGPAWNSGLRNGMVLESWSLTPGEMNREIELTLKPVSRKAKPRKFRYWPYGDNDVEARRFQTAVGLSDARRAECGRKLAGL